MKTVEKQPTKKKMDELDWSMWRWQAVVIVLGILLLVGYAIAFSSSANLGGEHGQEKWGQFGDFIGGIMNPLVAFAAFYWLTQSVKLQKQELRETREELAAAALAQKAQVENGRKSLRLAALTALINSAEGKLRTLNEEIRVLDEKLRVYSGPGWSASEQVRKLNEIRQGFIESAETISAESKAYVEEMKKILKEHTEGSSPT